MTDNRQFCYDHPRPLLTVDVVLFRRTGPVVEMLLVRRDRDPYRGSWAFPGGFVEIDEPLDEAARRELEEETGVKGVALRQLGAFGAPDRDPRGRTVSIAYGGIADTEQAAHGGDDAAEARWFAIGEGPHLAFDHDQILDLARRILLDGINYPKSSDV